MKRLKIFMGLILSLVGANVFAQVDMKTTGQTDGNIKQAGQTTMNFLQVGVSPTASSLGNATTSMVKGVEGVFSNPAGLPKMDSNFEGFISSTQWFADIKYLAAAVAWNAKEYGAVAVSAEVVDYGKIKGTMFQEFGSDLFANYKLTGDVPNVGSYVFGLTYVNQVSTEFSIGGTVKYAGQQLGRLTNLDRSTSDNNSTKYVFDMGVQYEPGLESFRLGMSIRNFSTFNLYQFFRSPLPTEFAMGISMNILDLFGEEIVKEHALFVSTDFVHPNNYTDRVNMGVEYSFMNMFALRGGYQSNHDLLSWSGGMGFSHSLGGVNLKLDYSYSVTKNFGGISRLSLGSAF